MGQNFFINSIESWQTEFSNSSLLPVDVVFGLKTAGWGHHYFGETDEARHVIGSFLVAERYGSISANMVTTGNEFYGFFRFDLPNLGDRFSGKSPWAFQAHDYWNNQKGIIMWEIYNASKTFKSWFK